MKKVILLLVDSLMPAVLEDCLRHKTVPALQFLKDRGRYWPDCVTVFPTMTATVDSSLVTGVYPDRHRIPGLIWYDPETKSIINYLNGWRCVWKLGLNHCVQNVLYDLNEKHLSKQVTTLFEELASRGKTSASLNAIIHRGTQKHQVRLPFLLNLITGFRFNQQISGPDVLTLGSMVQTDMEGTIPYYLKGLRHLFGINDKYAVTVAINLIRSGKQPDFMLVYLPDNDKKVHKKNPAHAEGSLIQVDHHLQEILNAFGSWEQALDQCVFIVTGDHGQTRIGKGQEFNVDLDKVLEPFRVLQPGEQAGDHDLVVCNNERSAYLYPLKPDQQELILQRLSMESRFDLIAWKKGKGVAVKEGGSGREVYFEPEGSLADIYGATWAITGEWAVLDLSVKQGILNYGCYPDALSRLYGALYSQDIPMIVVTARPRYELISRYYPRHMNGGCHGSLHQYDSLIPLLVAGTETPVKEPPRLVNLKQFVLGLFET
ncbi:alkaline phosphatase family protein [Effusibacillus lacus]|uniref:Antitoxin n=1 Tax=Effusibacillus lacus TaxID=1348429 RepID=A0A292YQE3_9BACL|nr:alkaline phosphatase family protein [Effusibacillus lacus]TCS71082.1 putative AlkP superfamily pyrophosphatase or phosphodiesterase [Effusibacillus lacus]GAX90725.1 antitoxin [Effusibacillus lacus]